MCTCMCPCMCCVVCACVEASVYTYFNRVPRSHDPLLFFFSCHVHSKKTRTAQQLVATRIAAARARRVRVCVCVHPRTSRKDTTVHTHTTRRTRTCMFFTRLVCLCSCALGFRCRSSCAFVVPRSPSGFFSCGVQLFGGCLGACRCARLLMCSSWELFHCSRRPRPRHGFPCACLSPRLTTRRTQL